MAVRRVSPRTVDTYLNYSHSDPGSMHQDPNSTEHERRDYLHQENTPDKDKRNVSIRSVRGNENSFTLSTSGFQLCTIAPPEIDYRDEAQVKEHYYPAVTELLKSTLAAKDVIIFHHHVRYTTLDSAIASPPDGEIYIRGPARLVHIDQTPATARLDLAHLYPETHEKFKGKPFGIFNIWRPLRRIQCDPLGLCDARTIREVDKCVQKYPNPEGGHSENYVLKYNRDHEWWFIDEMDVDEIVTFRIFDDRVEGKAGGGGVAHSAFVDPRWVEGKTAPRNSIEVRVYVFL